MLTFNMVSNRKKPTDGNQSTTGAARSVNLLLCSRTPDGLSSIYENTINPRMRSIFLELGGNLATTPRNLLTEDMMANID
ncbi:hypothetical protein Trydic_g8047 [Trypoxylus dichotomus]